MTEKSISIIEMHYKKTKEGILLWGAVQLQKVQSDGQPTCTILFSDAAATQIRQCAEASSGICVGSVSSAYAHILSPFFRSGVVHLGTTEGLFEKKNGS